MKDTSKKSRPLSPHLQVYRPQITTAMSIFHRITGVGLALGLPVLVLWLCAIMGGAATYAIFVSYAQTLLAQICLFGWLWAFSYHFCCGIRHLIWDAGRCISIKGVYVTGYIALGFSTLLTLIIWGYAKGWLS